MPQSHPFDESPFYRMPPIEPSIRVPEPPNSRSSISNVVTRIKEQSREIALLKHEIEMLKRRLDDRDNLAGV